MQAFVFGRCISKLNRLFAVCAVGKPTCNALCACSEGRGASRYINVREASSHKSVNQVPIAITGVPMVRTSRLCGSLCKSYFDDQVERIGLPRVAS